MKKNNISVSLFDGTGNSFLITDQADNKKSNTLLQNICLHPPVEFRKKLKQRKIDGYLFLKKRGQNFHWSFYNNDGSRAEMCGNAARCAAEWIYQVYKLENITIHAGKIKITANKEKKLWSCSWKIDPASKSVKNIFFINTGVPHLVLEEIPNKAKAQLLRKIKFPNQRGSNVTFVGKKNAQKISVTFERGVEDFTLSCGTGVIASAFFFKQKDQQSFPYKIQTPGGNLRVDFNSKKSKITLTGPVRKLGVLKI